MPWWTGFGALPVVFSLLLVGASARDGEMLRGMPEIVDGDTLILEGLHLHLLGIDAPELGQICILRNKSFDCGDIARAALLDLTAGSQVTCRCVEPADGERVNGEQALCTVDGYDLSEGMVYTGWALAEPARHLRYGRYESGARAAKRGLWRGAFVTPWEWRDGKRLAAEHDGKE